MPQVISDIVDVYVFRRLNARVQFLLLQRRSDVALPHTWQAFHSQVRVGDTTLETIAETVRNLAGLNVSAVFSADYVNQFYDESRDALILAPVFAVNVNPQAPIDLADDYRDAAWFDRDEATARLPFSGQRWAIRHIDEIMSLGDAETGIYRIDMETSQPAQRDPDDVADFDDDDSLTAHKYVEQDPSPAASTESDIDGMAIDSAEPGAPTVDATKVPESEEGETIHVSSARTD
jgi:dATP pyrophosphohydrolase